uniref:hypothetical protein n=1 Tax=Halomonas sp. TaxID=1486246 RepID=UPI00262A7ACB|nr:hypothetical protein [Halomonas sp.]
MATSAVAVITGDLIASRRADREAIYRHLDNTLDGLASRFEGAHARFRGDGFQLAMRMASAALDAAVMLRAELIAASPKGQRWDARLSIAVGPSSWTPSSSLTDADDAPFVTSGRALDMLSQDQRHLVHAFSEMSPNCFDNSARLQAADALLILYVDEMIGGWSPASAEVVAMKLAIENITQRQLAEALGIRQPSVHKRLQVARWELLDATLNHFRHLPFTGSESNA